ncbi:hypothetical protein [Nocardia brevicatena]|uniref:hypothetical protein n=1 Tax=Nocardia brevicatena TaxID=37327 RepID=UPI00030AA940|nr:hypothetical protein [Nocardia brevicatena]
MVDEAFPQAGVSEATTGTAMETLPLAPGGGAGAVPAVFRAWAQAATPPSRPPHSPDQAMGAMQRADAETSLLALSRRLPFGIVAEVFRPSSLPRRGDIPGPSTAGTRWPGNSRVLAVYSDRGAGIHDNRDPG